MCTGRVGHDIPVVTEKDLLRSTRKLTSYLSFLDLILLNRLGLEGVGEHSRMNDCTKFTKTK